VTDSVAPDHGVIDGAPSTPPPLTPTEPAPRLTPAEEARTLLAATNNGALATLAADGDPWASMIAYGLFADGSPVLCVSRLAEHGRNLERDPRASLLVTQVEPAADPLAAARVTLAGLARRPAERELAAAREAHLAGVPAGATYIDFSDFTLWVLRVERVRWVGGYGRMDSAGAEEYALAEPDQVSIGAASAVAHLNADHADALLQIAQALAGYPDATAAHCTGLDRRGIDLTVSGPRGRAPARVAFTPALSSAGELRAVTVALTHRARALLQVP
jgi:putative heme iron utilization protein